MAHRYWGFAEIVRPIAASLVSDKAVASAVSLASSSKSLKEPALGEVWRSLSSLAPLIKSFPPEAWELKKELLCFKRAPLRAEWIRFQEQYASRVRHLKVSSPEDQISSATFQLLQYLSDSCPLLPNLVSLSWETSDMMFIPLIFISPSLTSIDMEVPAVATPMVAPFLTKLSTLSPYISEIRFRIDEIDYDLSMLESSSSLLTLCNPNRLRKYIVDAPITTSALRHAIQLPSLESFWLVFNTSMGCQLPEPLPAVVFPNLRVLNVVHEYGDHTWLNLLPAIENPVLSSISVWSSEDDVGQFMERFQTTVTGCGMHERLKLFELRSLPVDDFKITPHIIACNFPLKNLTTLHMVTTCSDICQTSDLADGDIDLLTNALPCIESLMLGDAPCNIRSKITFKSLYTISRRCAQLTTLRLHFDPISLSPTKSNTEAWDLALGLSCSSSSELSSVKTLHVGEIKLWASDINSVAFGLMGVFPHLENIEFDDYVWRGVENLITASRPMGRFVLGI